MARELERPVRETVTPSVLQRVVWAGANLNSFPQAATALKMLADIELSAKQIRRITEQVGQDRLEERRQSVAEFRNKPLMQRLTPPQDVEPPQLGVVMMDGGRYQRRDHFGEKDYEGSHWKEDKVGIVLQMHSAVHDSDPHPEFPAWLSRADVVREIASLGTAEAEKDAVSEAVSPAGKDGLSPPAHDAEPTDEQDDGFSEFSPQLVSREVIASSECGSDFAHHLEFVAWQQGVIAAPRMAFVADGASVNWTIHKQHFSQMTGILDLMHALSYAYRAAQAIDTSGKTSHQWAEAIWQGRVEEVIAALRAALEEGERPADQQEPLQRALTYYEHHRPRMNYPRYRQEGLPLTSSHIESTIKLINIRMKGSEKFFGQETGETLLQLRADSLCTSQPLQTFWPRWLGKQNGANRYRKLAA